MLRDRGHEVEVLSFMEGQPEDPEYVTREELPSKRSDLLQLLAYRRIKEFAEDKDIIHSYNRTFDPAVGQLSLPTVATINSYMYDYSIGVPGKKQNPVLPVYRRLYDYLARRSIDRVGRLTALSKDVRDLYMDCFETDINVVPNMYDPDFPEFHDVETDENELLYVGALRKHKGVMELIDQMSEIPERYRLTVVGDGPQIQELEEMVSRLGLEKRVSFEGFIGHTKLPRYYERAGIFIHPARLPEPFGRTILEAMQMETPVIATNRGGPKDVLREEQLADTVEGIPEKIRQLDRQEAINYQNQRLEDYAPEKVTEMYEEIYREVA
jgi:glycosyltransferase involved in cell wall biosynthesis